MSSDFDWLMRGKMYCDSQKANSQEFSEGYDAMHWDEESKLVEIEEKGNHGRAARNFVLKEDLEKHKNPLWGISVPEATGLQEHQRKLNEFYREFVDKIEEGTLTPV